MYTRVATFNLQSTLLDASMRIQSRMAEKQIQSASGLKSETYAGLDAGTTTRVLNLQSSLASSQTLSNSLGLAEGRVDTIYSTVGSVIEKLTSLRSVLSSASTSTGSEDQLNSTAQGMLEDLEQLLNTQYNGRYLFGGSATTTPAVDLSALPTPSYPSTADTSYYKGTGDRASLRLGPDQSMDYGVTGDDEAIEKAIRAVNIAATMNTSPVDADVLAEAYDLATAALEGLTAIQGKTSIDAGRIEAAKYSEEALQNTLTNSITDLTQVDVAAVTTEIKNYEAQLQASYLALSSVYGISLSDYLK